MKWMNDGNNYCPVTGNPLRPSNLISDPTLQWKIQYWAKKTLGRDLAEESKNAVERQMDYDENVLDLTGFISLPEKKFICPLTKDVMVDPVMTKTGFNFERKALEDWLDKNGSVCPISSEPLYPSGIVGNKKLQWDIRQWQLNHGDASQEMTRLELETKLSKAEMISKDYQIADILRALTEGVDMDDYADEQKKKPAASDRANVLEVLDEVVGALDDLDL